LELIGIIRIFL